MNNSVDEVQVVEEPCQPSSSTKVKRKPAERVFSHLVLVKSDNQNAQAVETTDAYLKTKFWMLNQNKKPHELIFPKELVQMAQRVESNLPVQQK